jgi:fructose-1,6-bisphosphatase/sedoheptulose 1,7-bisphosphatase-like protein
MPAANSPRRTLTTADWKLLIGVAAAQVVAAAAVRVMPASVLGRKAARLRPIVQRAVCGPEHRVIWAIHATGRRLGRVSSCLVRALVADLVIEGTESRTLTIGVRRTRAGALEAHVWLTRGDRILVGATADTYAPLVEWDTFAG